MEEHDLNLALEEPALGKAAESVKLLPSRPMLTPETVALIQQLSQPSQMPAPVQPTGELDLAGLVMLGVTLLGGGGAGWRAWLRSRQTWQEQISESRKILIDNEDQHRKLNAIRDHLENLTEMVKSIERKLPLQKQSKSSAKATKDKK